MIKARRMGISTSLSAQIFRLRSTLNLHMPIKIHSTMSTVDGVTFSRISSHCSNWQPPGDMVEAESEFVIRVELIGNNGIRYA